MKKKIALLGTLGVAAAGLIYALESQHKRNKAGKTHDEAHKKSIVSGDGAATTSEGANPDGDGQTEAAASMARIEEGQAVIGDAGEHQIDDQGTGQSEAAQILRNIRDHVFDANDQKLALALGRPTEEIEEWSAGNGSIDGDVLMKARTLAMQRGFEI